MTFGAVFPRAMRPAFRPGLAAAAAAATWWTAGGATAQWPCISRKARHRWRRAIPTFANPGTNNAAPGTADVQRSDGLDI